jgi:putative endonuclease
MASTSRRLYVGVTKKLVRRVWKNKSGLGSKFTKKYSIVKLVYYEHFTDIRYAIHREKQLKKYRREKKVGLIEQDNPDWKDLSIDWLVE